MNNQMIENSNYEIYNLNNGLSISAFIIKINELNVLDPDKEENVLQKQAFYSLITEIYRLSAICPNSIEILYKTKHSRGQLYKADIDIYLVIRAHDENRMNVNEGIRQVGELCCRTLDGIDISYDVIPVNTMADLLYSFQYTNTYSVMKSEQVLSAYCPISEYYYSVDYFKGESDINIYDQFINLLSNYPGVIVALDLMPRCFSYEEYNSIERVANLLNMLVQGIPDERYGIIRDYNAQHPADNFLYYYNSANAETFYYGINVISDPEEAVQISNRLVSLLNHNVSGEMRVPLQIEVVEASQIDIYNCFLTYPWNINYELVNHHRNESFWNTENAPRSLYELPFIITAEEANGFFHLPFITDESIPGISIAKKVKESSRISEKLLDENNILFGHRMNSDRNIGIPVIDFAKHMFVAGIPGTGKTTFCQNILYQLYKKGVNFIVVEPAKNEYRALLDVIPDLQVFTAGNSECNPLLINPFIPPKNVTLQAYKSDLVAAFSAAFDMEGTLERLFVDTVDACYANHGWRESSTIDDRVEVFGLTEFIQQFKVQMQGRYDREIRERLETAGLMRLNNLIKKDYVLFDTVHTVPIEDMLKAPTIIELNSISDMEQKSLIMSLILISLMAYAKTSSNIASYGGLNNVLLLEEAHVLLDPDRLSSDGSNMAVQLVSRILAEMRAAGYGLIVADQSPSKVSEDVIRLTGNKMFFRTVEMKDREILANSTKMDETMMTELASLSVGKGFLFNGETDIPELLQTPDFRQRNKVRLIISDEELKERDTYWKDRNHDDRPYPECAFCKDCSRCSFKIRSEGKYIAGRIMYEYFNYPRIDKNIFVTGINRMEETMQEFVDSRFSLMEKKRAINCAKIKVLRDLFVAHDLGLRLRNRKQLLKKLIKE